MTAGTIQPKRRRRNLLGIGIVCCALFLGCRANPNGGMAWPWQSGGAVTSVPQTNPNNPNVWTPTSPPAPAPATAWNPNPAPTTNNPIGRLADLMRRQNEQTRLSEQQREALAQMTDFQKQQAQQIAQLGAQRRDEELQKLQQQAEKLRQQQLELESLAELRRRALELDANNRDLHSQLAQTQQENRLFEDQTRLLKQQLDDTVARLNQARQAHQQAAGQIAQLQNEAQRHHQTTQQQIQTARQEANQRIAQMESVLTRRGGAKIQANSSVQRNLAPVRIAGLNVRQDGDVIRIDLPADQIFEPGSATLQSGAAAVVEQVADAVRQHYPRQVIGIEAHTDPNSVQGSSWSSNHQLSAAQATAVFEQLTKRHQFGVQQLFVLGHGANYPVASNGTSEGQRRNRRVEVVIYPETVDNR